MSLCVCCKCVTVGSVVGLLQWTLIQMGLLDTDASTMTGLHKLSEAFSKKWNAGIGILNLVNVVENLFFLKELTLNGLHGYFESEKQLVLELGLDAHTNKKHSLLRGLFCFQQLISWAALMRAVWKWMGLHAALGLFGSPQFISNQFR